MFVDRRWIYVDRPRASCLFVDRERSFVDRSSMFVDRKWIYVDRPGASCLFVDSPQKNVNSHTNFVDGTTPSADSLSKKVIKDCKKAAKVVSLLKLKDLFFA